MTTFDIASVPWGEPRIIQTRNGDRQIREWVIPSGDHPFWQVWRDGYLRQMGYTVSKYKGEWRVTEWRMPDGSDTPRMIKDLAQAAERTEIQRRAEQREVELPRDLAERYLEICDIY